LNGKSNYLLLKRVFVFALRGHSPNVAQPITDPRQASMTEPTTSSMRILYQRALALLLLVVISAIGVSPNVSAQEADTTSRSAPTRYGTLTGKVLDKETQEEIIGATIKLVGTKLGAISKVDGRFIIKQVPAGAYRVNIFAVGYEAVLKSDVIVSPGRPMDMTVELQHLIVKGQAIRDERR
jgi:hypothetical protein